MALPLSKGQELKFCFNLQSLPESRDPFRGLRSQHQSLLKLDASAQSPDVRHFIVGNVCHAVRVLGLVRHDDAASSIG